MFQNTGSCRWGENCQYSHDVKQGKPEVRAVEYNEDFNIEEFTSMERLEAVELENKKLRRMIAAQTAGEAMVAARNEKPDGSAWQVRKIQSRVPKRSPPSYREMANKMQVMGVLHAPEHWKLSRRGQLPIHA